MKIDVEPKIEAAKGLDKLRMEMSGIDALYVIRLSNGQDYTVVWESEELDKFQPNKTVSEMMKSWEEGILRGIEVNKKAAETGKHPTWKQAVYEDVEKHGRIVKEQVGWEAYKLSESSIKSFELFVKRDLKKVGKMELVKLV